MGRLITTMRFWKFIIILFFLWWAFDVKAQVPQGPSSLPEQWQLTLDVVKSKVQTLVIENNGLQVEYRKLIEQSQKLQQSINAQQYKNEQMARFLKERHGRTDQQVRINELPQIIKTKSQEARTYDEQLGNLKRNRQKAKSSQNIQPQVDDQLVQLRKQLEDESTQEVLLKNELSTPLLQNARMYDQLKRRKEQLETSIYVYESRMEELRQSSLRALPWPLRKKKLISERAQIRTRNNQMRGKIEALREGIDVLRDQVAGLERKVDSVQGQVTK